MTNVEETQAAYAWQAETFEYPQYSQGRRWSVVVLLAAVLAALLATAGIGLALLLRHAHPAAEAPHISPPQTTVVTAPAQPPAATVSADEEFLLELVNDGIPINDKAEAVKGGRAVCQYISAGHTPEQAAQQSMANNPALGQQDATMYITAAIVAYCPDVT